MANQPVGRLAFRIKHRGFPKRLPCLVCGATRRATWAGDRIHPACNRSKSVALSEYKIDNTKIS